MRDPHPLLCGALVAAAGGARLGWSRSEPWASATFSGARHLLAINLPPDEAGRLAGDLAEMEFAIPGHLVADIAVAGRRGEAGGVTLEIEALTLEEY